MGLRVPQMRGLALALLTLPLFSMMAAAQIAVSANDNKAVLVNGVNTVPPNPADDTATIIDLNVSPPKVIGEFEGAQQRGRPTAKRGDNARRVDRADRLQPEARSGRSKEAHARQQGVGDRPQSQAGRRDCDH